MLLPKAVELLNPPPPSPSRTRVHVDGPSSRIVGGPGGRGRAGIAALALGALTLVALVGSTAIATITPHVSNQQSYDNHIFKKP
jgi:hypothetical protein